MNISETDLPGVLLIEPRVFGDGRGWFLETWRDEHYRDFGVGPNFVQCNASRSRRGVLRGLHYQCPELQGKLVWVSEGCVLDVAVDIRKDSPHFGQWVARELSADNHCQLWIPEGFAHGFQVLSDHATFHYLCTRPYRADQDSSIAWDDPAIGISWALEAPELSEKDQKAPRLADIPRDGLPEMA